MELKKPAGKKISVCILCNEKGDDDNFFEKHSETMSHVWRSKLDHSTPNNPPRRWFNVETEEDVQKGQKPYPNGYMPTSGQLWSSYVHYNTESVHSINEGIIRDETAHTKFACDLYKKCNEREQREYITYEEYVLDRKEQRKTEIDNIDDKILAFVCDESMKPDLEGLEEHKIKEFYEQQKAAFNALAPVPGYIKYSKEQLASKENLDDELLTFACNESMNDEPDISQEQKQIKEFYEQQIQEKGSFGDLESLSFSDSEE